MRSIDAVPPAAENLFLSIVYIESVMFKFSNSSFRASLFSQCIVDVTSLIIPALAKPGESLIGLPGSSVQAR